MWLKSKSHSKGGEFRLSAFFCVSMIGAKIHPQDNSNKKIPPVDTKSDKKVSAGGIHI